MGRGPCVPEEFGALEDLSWCRLQGGSFTHRQVPTTPEAGRQLYPGDRRQSDRQRLNRT